MKNQVMRMLIILAASQGLLFGAEPRLVTPLEYRFPGPAECRLGNRSFSIDYTREKETSIREEGVVVHTIGYPDVISEVISSPSARTLLLRLSRVRSSGGSNYSYLLSIRETGDHRLAFEQWLPAGRDPMTKNRWIVELGAVSDDGSKVLLKMAEPSNNGEPPYDLGKLWETWDLKTLSIVKQGLTICD